jgi:hypothetical protein
MFNDKHNTWEYSECGGIGRHTPDCERTGGVRWNILPNFKHNTWECSECN